MLVVLPVACSPALHTVHGSTATMQPLRARLIRAQVFEPIFEKVADVIHMKLVTR
jgi:hypothetical protein